MLFCWTYEFNIFRLHAYCCSIKNNIYSFSGVTRGFRGFKAPLMVRAKTSSNGVDVLIDNKLQFNQRISNFVHKARPRACSVVLSFCSKDSKVFMKAFIIYVRLMLEYCSSFWSPSSVANITKREAIQRNFARSVSEFSHCDYYNRQYNLRL